MAGPPSELGPQGGDPRGRRHAIEIDLSTCICRYGPPPAALDALRTTPAHVLRHHPYEAVDLLRAAYAVFLGVRADELTVGRGASELLWQLAASPSGPVVAVPLAAYTEYRQAFPASAFGPPAWHHGAGTVEQALAQGATVLLSNPHNPSGRAFTALELTALASAYPQAALVVDESYVEFCADPARYSLIGSASENVAVIRSPSKFFGLAGARAGVAWSRNPVLRTALTTRRGSWPISMLDVRPIAAALAGIEWQHRTRAQLIEDARWLDAQLPDLDAQLPGPVPIPGAVAHFRLVPVTDAAERAEALAARHGVDVRVLGTAHGLPGPALRITAPRVDERERTAAALALLHAP